MQQKAVFFVAIVGFVYALGASRPDEVRSVPKGEAASWALVDSRTRTANHRPRETAADEMVLERGSGGQFHLTAQIDGQDTEFLVDTGADVVALTVEDAERLGFAVDPERFRPMMQTASGTGNGMIVRIPTLEVAGTSFHDVDAVVMDGLSTNLLGQNVLAELGQVSLEGDQMVIRR